MKHPVLSARTLVHLANENRLSLLLRHAWREKYDRDPYNDLRNIVAISNGRWMAGAYFVLFLAALAVGVMASIDRHGMLEGWSRVIALSIVFFLLAAGFALFVFFVLNVNKLLEQRIGHAFRQHMSAFLYVCKEPGDKSLHDVAKRTASLTPADLEQLAKNIVFGKVAEVEELDKNAEENEGNATWQAAKAEIMEEFRLAADTLRIFELVYGSNQDLFREGRRRWNAKNAEATQVASAAAPEAVVETA